MIPVACVKLNSCFYVCFLKGQQEGRLNNLLLTRKSYDHTGQAWKMPENRRRLYISSAYTVMILHGVHP